MKNIILILFFTILVFLLFSCGKEKTKKFEGCYTCDGELLEYGSFWNSTDSTLYRDTIISSIDNLIICISEKENDTYLLTYSNDTSNQLDVQVLLNDDNSFSRNDGNIIYELNGFFIPNNCISFWHIINNTGTIITKRILNCTKNE